MLGRPAPSSQAHPKQEQYSWAQWPLETTTNHWKLSQNLFGWQRWCFVDGTLQLTDDQLDLLCDLLPDDPPGPLGGRPRTDKRKAIAGIFWVLDNGAKWKWRTEAGMKSKRKSGIGQDQFLRLPAILDG